MQPSRIEGENMNNDTLNTTEAADLLKVHPKTVEDLIKDGTIPAAKVGRAWVMLKAHVLQYLENKIIQETSVRRGMPAPTIRTTTRKKS